MTGEITDTGEVKGVGSVYVKTLIAMLDKLDYFIDPIANEQEALEALKELDSKLQIIPVSTTDEAKQWLQSVNE